MASVGVVLSHPFLGQFSGGLQGSHSQRDRHEGDVKRHEIIFERCHCRHASGGLMHNFCCVQVAMNVYELSSAAGLPCEIDPALVVALSSQKSGENLLQLCTLWSLFIFVLCIFTCCLCLKACVTCKSTCLCAENISPEEEYKIACLLMVFVAVSLPTLASNVMSQYSPAIEGNDPSIFAEMFHFFSLTCILILILLAFKKCWLLYTVDNHKKFSNYCTFVSQMLLFCVTVRK